MLDEAIQYILQSAARGCRSRVAGLAQRHAMTVVVGTGKEYDKVGIGMAAHLSHVCTQPRRAPVSGRHIAAVTVTAIAVTIDGIGMEFLLYKLRIAALGGAILGCYTIAIENYMPRIVLLAASETEQKGYCYDTAFEHKITFHISRRFTRACTGLQVHSLIQKRLPDLYRAAS